MNIRVNDECFEVPAGFRVANVIIDRNLAGQRGIAVALNDEVVPQKQWSCRALQEGDSLLIIRASQGG